jgi:DnaJ family protein A protein 2
VRVHSTPISKHTEEPCEKCNATGKIRVIPENCCVYCGGWGYITETKSITLDIEKGTPSGHKIVIKGASDIESDREVGDVVFTLVEEKHPVFKRNGNDLYTTQTIQISESLTGLTTYIQHLDKRVLTLTASMGDHIENGI